MRLLKTYRVLLAVALLTAGVLFTEPRALAQADAAPQSAAKAKAADEGASIEIQLYLIIASKTAGADDEKLPAALDPVLKQLRAAFTFKNYRLVETSLNRVKQDGRLELKWVGGPLLPPAAATNVTPGFNEFKVGPVRLGSDERGRDVVQLNAFRFGARIPIQVATVASTGTATAVQYESTGLSTDISVREGEPTVVGTLNVGPSGDALIIVVSARKPSNR